MSGLEESLRTVSDKVKLHSDQMLTEEAVKTAVVLPVLRALGYDVFNPLEVVPEFTADAVGKKGEKVDYALKVDDEIRILIECKPISTALERKHTNQLFRYFSVTSAKFAILTNGRIFQFYTDLDEQNKLDSKPFFTFDIAEMNSGSVSELKKFEKSAFDIPNILATAERLKYTSGIKQTINSLIDDPSEEFVRLVSANIYEGRMTAAAKEMLTSITKTAFREVITDALTSRLASAFTESNPPDPLPQPSLAQESEIITTEEEIEGYMIVKSILREEVKPSRVIIRDAKSYCAVLLDDNNRKPITRLHFNRSIKYIGLFDGDVEERVVIETLDDIYNYSERLRAAARKYDSSVPA